MKRIFCPVDFSEAANNAVEYAARLAKHHEAQLTLFHAVITPTLQDVANISTGAPVTTAAREDEASEKLRAYSQTVEKTFKVPTKAIVRSHNAGIDNVLGNEINNAGHDLVVMGTNGADGLSQFYFGTHTYKMIRHITQPLLLVPQGCQFKKPGHIVYATDYDKCDAGTINKLFELTSIFHPEVTVLHISRESATIRDDVYRCIKNLMENTLIGSRIHFKRVIEEDVAAGLHTFMNNDEHDLLVLLTGQYSLTEKVFHTSVTKKLSYIATYPILCFHKSENQDKS